MCMIFHSWEHVVLEPDASQGHQPLMQVPSGLPLATTHYPHTPDVWSWKVSQGYSAKNKLFVWNPNAQIHLKTTGQARGVTPPPSEQVSAD